MLTEEVTGTRQGCRRTPIRGVGTLVEKRLLSIPESCPATMKRPAARKTGGKKATKQLAKLKAEKLSRAEPQASADDLDVPPLRRALLRSAETVKLYMGHVRTIRTNNQLPLQPQPECIDRCLEIALNQLYTDGHGLQEAINLYSAVKWYYAMTY